MQSPEEQHIRSESEEPSKKEVHTDPASSAIEYREGASARDFALNCDQLVSDELAALIDDGPFSNSLKPALMFLGEDVLRELAPISEFRQRYSEEYSLTGGGERKQLIEELQQDSELLNRRLDSLKELTQNLTGAFSQDSSRYGFVVLADLKRLLEADGRELSYASHQIKKDYELKERLSKFRDAELGEAVNAINTALEECPNFDWHIDAEVVASDSTGGLSFSHTLSRIIRDRTVDVEPDSVDDSTLDAFARVVRFARHIKQFQQRQDESSSYVSRSLNTFDGRDVCYGMMLDLAHQAGRSALANPQLRDVLAPLLEDARQEYLEAADIPLSDDTAYDHVHSTRAMFIETALVYEREFLRTEALQRGSLGSLIALSFSWGHDSCVESTGRAAGELFCKVADELREQLEKGAWGLDMELRSALDMNDMSEGGHKKHTLARTIERASYRDGPQFDYTHRHFFETATNEQFDMWVRIATGHEVKMAGYSQSAPVSTLMGVGPDTLKSYLGTAGRENIEVPLPDLFGKFSREEALHLLEIGASDLPRLIVLSREYQPGGGWQGSNLTKEEVMAAAAVQPLTEKLSGQFRDQLEPLVTTSRESSHSQIADVADAGMRAYCEECTGAMRDRIDLVVDGIFAGATELKPEELQNMLISPRFGPLITGVADTNMLLSPTGGECFVVTSPADEILKVMDYKLFHQPQSDFKEDSEISTQEWIHTQLCQVFSEHIADLQGMTVDRVAEALQQSFSLREEAWRLMHSDDFASRVLEPMLSEINKYPRSLNIRVAAKSDPATWTLPVERAHTFRADAALLVTRFDGKDAVASMFVGEDERSVLLEHLPIPENLDRSKHDQARAAISTFLEMYCEGRCKPLWEGGAARSFDRLVIGPVYKLRENEQLELAEPIAPIGDCPETRGKGLRAAPSGDYSQRIFWKR